LESREVKLFRRLPSGPPAEVSVRLTGDVALAPAGSDIEQGDVLEEKVSAEVSRYLRVDRVRLYDSGPELSFMEMSLTVVPRNRTRRPANATGKKKRPRVFIGSSTEGLEIAEYVQLGLQYVADCTVWNQEALALSELVLEGLARRARDYDFAVLVLTPDDVVIKRDVKGNTPRDNVMFELGLFIGVLGRERTFVVCGRENAHMLPTDLAGLIPATFDHQENRAAALGPVCRRLKTAMGI